MFGRFVTGFKQALQVQSEPPTPSPGSPIPGGARSTTTTPRDAPYQQPPAPVALAPRFASSGSLERCSPSPTPDLLLDGLSEAERAHILSVMARADSNVDINSTATTRRGSKIQTPSEKPESSFNVPTTQDRKENVQKMPESKLVPAPWQGSQSMLLPLSSSTSVSDIPLDGLTEEERSHILRVMARAESSVDINNANLDRTSSSKIESAAAPSAPSPAPSSSYDEEDEAEEEEEEETPLDKVDPTDLVDPTLASQLENSGLEEWELRQIMNVMNKARRESDARESLPPPEDETTSAKPTPSVPQQQTRTDHREQRREKTEAEQLTKLKHESSTEEGGVFNEVPRRLSAGSDDGARNEKASDNEEEDGVHSDETEGADEESPIEEGSGYSSPSPVVEPQPLSRTIDSYESPLDNSRKAPEAPEVDSSLLSMLPEGMESLSAEEQEQILAVLRRAAMESGAPPPPPPPPPPTAPVISSEWHQQAAYPSNNNNITNQFKGALLSGASNEEDRDYDDRIENDYEIDVPIDIAGRRGVPDLTFEISEEQSIDQDIEEQQEYSHGRLGGVSPVSITIQPPSPCPTDESCSDEEDDYWTKAQKIEDDERERNEQEEAGEESEYDQPREEISQSPEINAEPSEDYESMWAARDEEEYSQQKYDDQPIRSNVVEEIGETTDDAQWNAEVEFAPRSDYETIEEDAADDSIMAQQSSPIAEQADTYPKEKEQQTLGQHLRDEDALEPASPISDRQPSPISDRQPSPIEYAAGDEGEGNDADNEEERYDRFDIDGAESSSYDDGNAAATSSSYYGTTDYYMPEYQRSESGSSSGYGSRGVLGLSSYASGEALSQQSGAGILVTEVSQFIGVQTLVDSGLSRASSLQEQFGGGGGDGGRVVEIAATRKLVDEPKFVDVMTKSAPAESGITAYEISYDGFDDDRKVASAETEPIAEYYEEQEYWTGDSAQTQETVESKVHEAFAYVDVREAPTETKHVVTPPNIEDDRESKQSLETRRFAVEPLPEQRDDSNRGRQSDQWAADDDRYSYAEKPREPAPTIAASTPYKESPQHSATVTLERRTDSPSIAQAQAPTTPKTPERTSLFGSLRQAASSPTPKSAFGSFFSGASQALKSQTEAVLKKAVDTVNQVAAAGDAAPRPTPPMPPMPPPSAVSPASNQQKIAATFQQPDITPTKTGSMETLLGDYDYDSQYSLKKMIRHEPIVPAKEEIIVQQVHVHQAAFAVEEWSSEPKRVFVHEPRLPPEPPAPIQAPTPQPPPQLPIVASPTPPASSVIEVPGMPDLDLTLFNEEERAHLMAMIGKAKEMEAELHSTPSSAAPSRSASFSQHGSMTPVTAVLEEEDEPDEETMRLLESYTAATSTTTVLATIAATSTKRFATSAIDTNTLPWPVPAIREIGATPECHVDVAQAFAAAAAETGTGHDLSMTYTIQQQQYDSSEVSSTMCEDEADQQQRMTEIEADLSGDGAHPETAKSETPALAECPLCNRMVLRCSQGSYGATGQMCADCGVVVCTECGSVVPRYMGKVWLCGQCQFEEQAQIQKQYEQHQRQQQSDQRTSERNQQMQSSTGSGGSSMSARRRRRRTTAVAHRRQQDDNDLEEEDEDDDDEHFRPSAALSLDEPKIIVRAMAKPSARDGNDSDESDEDLAAHRGADDDDYPDEVIEVPPAPLSPEPPSTTTGMPISSMDNGNLNGGGLGADVLAAITSAFSSSSSDGFSFGDALVDSTPERRSHLQQQQIAFGGGAAASLGQTAPPPVPARTHRAAPPPPAATSSNTLVSEQRPATGVFASNTGAYHSIGVTDSSQFPPRQEQTKADFSSMPEMSRETVEQKRNSEEADRVGAASRDRVVDSAQQERDRERMDETVGLGGGAEDEQANGGESEEEEEEEEEEQIDYAQAMKYYNNNPFFTHRPGPVYTIPEDEESDELSAEIEEPTVSAHYRDMSRPGISPSYQQLLKQHQMQQQLRQQQQQLQQQQQQSQSQPLTSVNVSQPSTTSAGQVYHKRNPFIDEDEEEYDNDERFSVDQQQPTASALVSSSAQQQRLPQAPMRVGAFAGLPAAAAATAAATREVTSLVSSQQYFATQQQLQQQKPEQQISPIGRPLSAQASAPAASIPALPISTGVVRVGFVLEQGAAASSISAATQATTSLSSAYAPPPASITSAEEDEYGVRATRAAAGQQLQQQQQRLQQYHRGDVETRYAADEEQASTVSQRQQPNQQHLLQQKRQGSGGAGAPAIDYMSSSTTRTEPGAVVGRPTLAFHDEDSTTTGHYHVQPSSQPPLKAKEKASMAVELTPASSTDELFYQQGTTTIGQLVWKRDDQQQEPTQAPTATMTVSQSSGGSRSSEDEEAQDLDNQFVSKLKRSPAMILHADAAAAAAAAAAGRRSQIPAGQSQQQLQQLQLQQQQSQPHQQQQLEYYDDVLTDEAPVAWPTFLGQKTPAPHQLPPFPPPPVGGAATRQRFPVASSEDQASVVASSGLASAPSSTITGSGGGAVSAAGSRAPEMGRRKLPSIPQAPNAAGTAPCEQPYSVGGHYGSTPFVVEQQQHQQQQQQQLLQSQQHEVMNSTSQSWRSGTAGAATAAGPTAAAAKDQRLRLVHATPSLRMPATLARVLLKQELREALTKRQQQLEACEIEANQRQYSVQRYLHTGIYPPSVGLQPTTPRTVLCTLPPELLAGCRIQYHPPSALRSSAAGSYSASNADNVSYVNRPWSAGGTGGGGLLSMSTRGVGASTSGGASLFRSTTTTNATSSTKQISSSWPASYRDACIMTDPEYPKTTFVAGRSPRTTLTTGPASKNSASMTIQFNDAETQTWATTTSAAFLSTDSNQRNNKDNSFSSAAYGASRSGRTASGVGVGLSTSYPGSASKTVSTSTEDLDREREHAQSLLKKQHRKLRATASASSAAMPNLGYYSNVTSGNQRDHHQSKRLAAYFSDEEDDQLTREMRKSKIKDEIARRRQNLGPAAGGQGQSDFGASSMTGVTLPPYYASDYSSHVPHYGSLPRMDFPSRHQFGGPLTDTPMNRSMNAGALDNYGMQAPGVVLPPPRRAISLGGSGESDYLSGFRAGYYGSGHHPGGGRGLTDADYFSDFGDYMSMSARGDTTGGYYSGARPIQSASAGALRNLSSSAPYLNILSDTPNYRPVTGVGSGGGGGGGGAGAGGGGDSGLLSHYASYLNREFANSSNALAAGAADSYSQSWRRTALPDSSLPVDGPFAPPPPPSQNQSMWPPPSSYMTPTVDRTPYASAAYDYLPGAAAAAAWRSSMPYASAYRSTFQPQLQQQQTYSAAGLSMPAPNTITDPSLIYGFSTYPDRSWMRNAYRPAYQHQYIPPSSTASLPSARSLDALRTSFGLTSGAGAAYSGGVGTAYGGGAGAGYGVGGGYGASAAGTYGGGTLTNRTPYWSPLEISAATGTLGGDYASVGSFPSGTLGGGGGGGGFGNAIRYDSGYSSGGAGAGYASDSYHSNIGGLGDRQQQSSLGRQSAMAYGNRAPAWSSSDTRSIINPTAGYVSDSTLERRRFKTASGNPHIDDGTFRSRNYEVGRRGPDGSRVKRVLLTKMGKERISNGGGLGMKIIGGKIIPGTEGDLGAFVASIHKGGLVDTLGEVKEGDQILEWNSVPLTGKTYEDVQRVIENSHGEIEIVLRSFNNNNNNNNNKHQHQRTTEIRREDSETDYGFMNGHAKMIGDTFDAVADGNQSSYFFKQGGSYNETMMDGKASPCFSTTPRSRSPLPQGASFVTGLLRIRLRFDCASGTLFVHVLSARDLRPRSVTASTVRSGYPNPFVKVYLLPGRVAENKRRTKFVSNTCNPEWDQTVVYKELRLEDLHGRYLEFTVWDYDRFVENQFLGRVLLTLADSALLSGVARYFQLQPLA